MKSIKELKNIHSGEDIYIIASGKSIDYINNDFFDNKIKIGVNQVYKKIECDYLVRKEIIFLEQSLDQKSKVIVSEFNCGNKSSFLNKSDSNNDNLYYFEHSTNRETDIDKSVFGTDKIVVSYSTITSAMHIGAYMGAKNIILVGHDCGTLNGESTFRGYYSDINETPWDNWDQYKKWLKMIESQTILVKNELYLKYGVNVVSINPFVSLNLENNIYN